MKRPKPSAAWRTYKNVDCPQCGTTHATAPARFRSGAWEIRCPSCGVQPWRARLSDELRQACAQLRTDAMASACIPQVIALLRGVV